MQKNRRLKPAATAIFRYFGQNAAIPYCTPLREVYNVQKEAYSMKRKKWDSKTKGLIVLEVLKGSSVAEICVEQNLSQSQYYKWRDQLLSEGYNVFDQDKEDQKQLFLEKEKPPKKTQEDYI
jgi:transposase-like protein